VTVGARAPRGLLLSLLAIGCSTVDSGRATDAADADVPAVPRAELSMAADAAVLLDSADALIHRDSSVALVTVDESGRPRVRTVRAFRLEGATTPRERFTVYVLTRMSTRKVPQVEANARATLYFNEDQRVSYATVMGRATVHRDPSHPKLQSFLDSGTVRFFWPDFPRDFVILEITPEWLEYIGPGLWNDPQTWRPQAVVFD
jgi:general stress protein 26